MKKIVNILAGALLLFSSALFAQQESTFTLYRYHMNMVNPAYAGVDGQTVITGSVRRQWSGIGDAPSTQAVSFGTSLGKNLGFGVSVVNDKIFVQKQNVVGVDFSYKVKVDAVADLYLGVKAGGHFYDVNTFGLVGADKERSPLDESTFNPNIGVGALLKSKSFYMSLSIPNLINSENYRNLSGYRKIPVHKPHVYWSSGYDINLNPDASLVLKPSFMLRYVNGSPVSFDFNTMLNIQNYVEFGGMYSFNRAYAGIVDFTISKKLMVGYAYEAMTSSTQLQGAGNTHEFFIKFTF
jgi:type IX secretion system PorP/SprF family membrane protein